VATTWFSADKGEAVNGRIGMGLILPHPANPLTGPTGAAFFPLAGNLSDPVIWHAGAAWSKALEATTPAAWENELGSYSKRLAAPLSLK
jgi:hypothetical protein